MHDRARLSANVSGYPNVTGNTLVLDAHDLVDCKGLWSKGSQPGPNGPDKWELSIYQRLEFLPCCDSFSMSNVAIACSVSSAIKFFGMSAFRLSTVPSAAARFSGDAGASRFVSVMDRTPFDMLGEPSVSTLRQRCFLPTFLIAYSAKGA